MAFNCKIVADSISLLGKRITSFEITFPRWMLAELNTHRALSRNAASSRAIPVKKMIERIREDPYVPDKPMKNQTGMQPAEPLSPDEVRDFRELWLRGLNQAIELAETIGSKAGLNVHKQWTNRLLEPWMWCTDLVTATELENFFALRTDHRAAYDFQKIACMMYAAMKSNNPQVLEYGEWHLPYINPVDRIDVANLVDRVNNPEEFRLTLLKISTARCARLSYLTQDGKRDLSKDLELYDRLLGAMPRHSSPAEHQATPALPEDSGHRSRIEKGRKLNEYVQTYIPSNLQGWNQFRKFVPDECVKFFNPTPEEIDRWSEELGIDTE